MPPPKTQLADKVGAQVTRKLTARRHSGSAWLGLGMMGLIGWSIVVPTVLGAALGAWIDGRGEESHSWTLALLVGGLCIGCWNAWRWLAKEARAMHDEDGHV